MKNSIDVSIHFSYQGKNYAPSLQVDLELLLEKSKQLPSFYQLIAQANNIDTYSYLYEVMQQSDILFTNAQGLAANFLSDNQFDNHFDSEGFSKKLSSIQLEKKLQQIVLDENNDFSLSKDLTHNKALKNTLLKAYQLGINESQ